MRLARGDAEPQRAALRLARHRQQRRRSTRLTLAERPTCLATQGRAAQPKAAPAAIPVMDDSITRRKHKQVFGRARKSCSICQRGSGTPRDGASISIRVGWTSSVCRRKMRFIPMRSKTVAAWREA
jgi:hypothetical protein